MARDCTINSQGCTVCPALPSVPSQPGYIGHVENNGWNAGANTVQVRDGDLRLAFTVGQAAAMVVGLRRLSDTREGQTVPARVLRGWRIRTVSGNAVADVFEAGVSKTNGYSMAPCTVLEVRRVGRRTEYTVDNSVVHSTVELPRNGFVTLDGPVFATACLYASGDTVGACQVT